VTERCGVRFAPDGREFVITGIDGTAFGFAALFVLIGTAAATALVRGQIEDMWVRFYALVFVVSAALMLSLAVARIFGEEVFLVHDDCLVRRNRLFGFSRQQRFPLDEVAQLDAFPALASLPISMPGMRGLQREIDTWRLGVVHSGRFLYVSGRSIRGHTMAALLSVLADEHPALLELTSAASVVGWSGAEERHDSEMRRMVAAVAVSAAALFSTAAVAMHDFGALLVVPAVVGGLLSLFVAGFALWDRRHGPR